MSTVLIAAPEHLAVLKERDDLSDAQAFSDAEALRALEVITRKRPDVVALEKLFAATTRGAALINRIKADPKLASCEIKIVAHDAAAAARPAGAAAAAVAVTEPEPVVVPGPAPPPAGAPLDQTGTRRAPRFAIVDGVEVIIDGNVATLVNLSLVGAQVLSTTILKPNQRVRMSIADAKKPLRFTAAVAWASFELSKTGPRYRAGIEFFDADGSGVQKFIDSKKR